MGVDINEPCPWGVWGDVVGLLTKLTEKCDMGNNTLTLSFLRPLLTVPSNLKNFFDVQFNIIF